MLQVNLDKLDDNFAQLLRSWAKTALSRASFREAQDIAASLGEFSNLIAKFPLGSKAINLEIVIAGYEAALKIFTRDSFPAQWATTRCNLGATYCERILGDRTQNIEDAIASCKLALQVQNPEAQDWALTQNTLGVAYRERIVGDRVENIEDALNACQAALQVYTKEKESFLEQWAMAQTNLGNAYCKRIKGDQLENIEKAIVAYKFALQFYTKEKEAFLQDWVGVYNNLGNAYQERIFGDQEQNIEDSLMAYQTALHSCCQKTLPKQWAEIQNNLGNSFCKRIQGDREQNLDNAIKAYQAALQVRTQDAFPKNHAQTLFHLGIAYQNVQQFIEAYTSFNRAIETVELLRGEIVSGDESKRKQAEEWSVLYCRMVEVCLELDNITEAIEYAERSKTRNLVELILERDLKTIFPSEVVTQLEQLRDEIASGQYQLQNGKAENSTALAQHLQQLRQQGNDLQNRHLRIGYGFKLDQFQASLDKHTTVVEWYITDTGFETFIITRNSLQRLKIANAAEQRDAVVDWVNEYLKAYYQTKDEWENSLASRLSRLAEILHLEDILPLVPKTCSRLVLIPHTFLHLLPIQALPFSQNGKTVCLLDRFPNGVSYAPSCQLLLQAQQRKRPNFTHLFAIQNPTNDLAYTDLEVQAITDYFNPVNILEKETATLTAINDTNLNAIHCAHFSCHGYFNPSNARKSALILANASLASTPANPDTARYLNVREGETHDLNQCLTLDAILSLNLEQCRLVTLSACETGLIDFFNTSDEYIGLPSGFLIAGSPSVVSSLWRVNDLSTALLMIKFYQNLKSGSTVALALNQAQTWLRDATTAELQTWTNSLNLDENLTKPIRKKLSRRASHEQPFHSPYHWAAFCAIGQ
ncbi:MAG: CHAT domain-containing tetratricopeptide repeat protein [Coleofasciculus sp. G1-WW12-02]|uniref:CHAT domain-containing protein n=1 Tax=Coleofasciculus sp. G1-WW12-02 TaxID=3068483 RepID=UPI0032F2C49A